VSDCLFCRIAAGSLPAKIVLQDPQCVAFEDLHPQAPTHVLVIPRKHVNALRDCGQEDQAMLGHLLLTCAAVARQKGLAEHGYRVVANSGRDGGQTVDHLHFHVLGGRAMTWPPG
jgi:histidine triad (HIT) family protein